MNPERNASLVRAEAYRLGFDFAGFSAATFLEEEAPRLEQWLLQGSHGKMKYMENYFDKRLDPRMLVDGAKSVVSLLYNYCPPEKQRADAPQISAYAYGEDYHEVIREKLNMLLQFIREKIGDVNGRCFVDSAPVLERTWAAKSGLGWVGKNTNLITKKYGSLYFIAELILDLEFAPDSAIEDYCGTCTRCIDACPTGAITPYVVDGSKCISYFTIELKEEIPSEWKSRTEDWVFGCDTCQDVCPWNRFAEPHHEMRFSIRPEIRDFTEQDWDQISDDAFRRIFKNSAVKRTGYKGLKRNLAFRKPS